MKKTYYKIVRYNYMSLNYSCTLKYRVGYWTTPKIKDSKLFVFGKLQGVTQYISRHLDEENYKIFECEVDSPTRLKFCSFIVYEKGIKNFWQNYSKIKERRKLSYGTVLVGKVKLLREVKL